MEAAVALADLRESKGTTQVELANRLGVHQGNVSRLERRDDLYLSTLREYVKALGGELRLVVEFPDGEEVVIEPAREAVAVG
jgi:transcriptional regulator with XRE-family HTH domain